ncbi:MAG: ABC transporter permease [Promethearchaeota archaeon]
MNELNNSNRNINGKSKSKRAILPSAKLSIRELIKDIKIIFRGSRKWLILLSLIFPFTYLMFMYMVFGQESYSIPAAVVVKGYNSASDLEEDISNGKLNETLKFISYLNNDSLVGKTIIKLKIVNITWNSEELNGKFQENKILLIINLPANFEDLVRKARKIETGEMSSENWTPVMIELKCANINEDLLKNIYFSFERKLKAYYDIEFPNEVEVRYIYEPALNTPSYPRIWTISSGAIVYCILTNAMVVGSMVVFIERDSSYQEILTRATKSKIMGIYFGKLMTSTVIISGISTPIFTVGILLFSGMQPPQDYGSLIVISLASGAMGSALGMIFGSLLSDSLYSFPTSVFIMIPLTLLCGGFVDIEVFPLVLQEFVKLIPLTPVFSLMKASILPGIIAPQWNVFALVAWLVILIVVSAVFYERRVRVGSKIK